MRSNQSKMLIIGDNMIQTYGWIENQIERHGKAQIFDNGRKFTVTLSPRGSFMIETKGTCHAVHEVRDILPAIQRMVHYA
jgi:hypothetical protein